MKELTAQGFSIGEIAAEGRERLLVESREPAPLAEEAAKDVEGDRPELRQIRERLLESARTLDPSTIENILDECFEKYPEDEIIDRIMVPAAREMGFEWARGTALVASEHLLTGAFSSRVAELLQQASRKKGRGGGPQVICACLPDELHHLGSLILAYYLTRAGAQVIYLGPQMPLNDLESACSRLQPDYVLLSVTRPAILDIHLPRLLELVNRQYRQTRFYLGGPGVTPTTTIPGVEIHPPERRLTQLVEKICG